MKATGLKNFETRIIGKLCETVSKIIREILGDKISLLKATLIANIVAVGKFPDHKTVVLNLSPQDLSIAGMLSMILIRL